MIVLTGISHHTAGIEIREKVALSDEAARDLASRLGQSDGVAEVFVVSTCNRVEIIASSRGDDEPSVAACAAACRQALLDRAPDAHESIYTHRGTTAVRHLVRVAASLDSLVVGEAQILGQLKQGFEAARQSSTVGATLHQLFARAARGAKRVRSETSIGVGQVSVPSIAVELAGQIFGEMAGRKAVLIGAGEMGQTVARLLRDQGAHLTVVGRNQARIDEVCAKIDGRPALLDTLSDVLIDADVVVSSTSAPHHVVTSEHLKGRKKARRGGNLFLIDLAVPRDIDPAIGSLEGTFLYDVDDLCQVASESTSVRKKAADEAECIVDEVVGDWERRQSARLVTPTIKALRAKMRRGLEAELGRSLRGRLRDLTEDQRAALAKMLDAGLNRILHEPVTRLRDEATREERFSADELAGLLSTLFGLSEIPPEDLDVSGVRLPDEGGSPSDADVSYLPDGGADDSGAHLKAASGKIPRR